MQERSAVDIDGRWQLVDDEFMGTLLEIIILTAQQNGWSLDTMPEDEAMEALVDGSYDARCNDLFHAPVVEQEFVRTSA